MRAQIGGAVDAGLAFFGGAGTHEDGGFVVEGADATEIQVFSLWNLEDRPGLAAVGGAEDGAFGAADPDDVVVDGAETAEAGFARHGEGLPLSGG